MDANLVVKLENKKNTKKRILQKQDEFLDVYSLYLQTGLDWIKQEAILKAYELHMLDSKFQVEI